MTGETPDTEPPAGQPAGAGPDDEDGKKKSRPGDFIDTSNLIIADFEKKPARAAKGGSGRKPPEKPPPQAGDDPGARRGRWHDSLDGIVAMLNEEYALILMGSRAVIMREKSAAPVEDRARVLSIDAFKAYFHNRGSMVWKQVKQPDGSYSSQKSYVKWALQWLAHSDRRTYDGIEFFPDPDNAAGTPNYFNLWRGFSCVPDRAPPDERRLKYKTFRDHLFTNICCGNQRDFDWLFAWFAHMVQRPRERIGTGVALRGVMGAGKTKIGEVFGSLFLSHYFLVDDPRYVTGQFNAHMASCLLLHVDEGFWAGDKAAEGRLKGLVTASKQMIEAKGVDPIRLDNFVRLFFTSNANWVIPAALDERRFCVLDVAQDVAQRHEYFAEMDRELDNGGREALLADLLTYDLDAPGAPNLRIIPKTAALLEQKLRSLDPVESWWFERLTDGATTRRSSIWNRLISVDVLFDDFVHMAEKIGVRRKAEKTSFGMQLRKLVPGIARVYRTIPVELGDGTHVMRRQWCLDLPSLDECRAAFDTAAGQSVDWGPEGEEGRPEF
ncbi:MAG: primase-helicase family protein [Methylocella sp.]